MLLAACLLLEPLTVINVWPCVLKAALLNPPVTIVLRVLCSGRGSGAGRGADSARGRRRGARRMAGVQSRRQGPDRCFGRCGRRALARR